MIRVTVEHFDHSYEDGEKIAEIEIESGEDYQAIAVADMPDGKTVVLKTSVEHDKSLGVLHLLRDVLNGLLA